MTHYYLYIECGAQLDADTIFYKVGIGESEKQRKIYAWLESYAIEHGHYFVLWSSDAADFYFKCSESIGPEAKPLVGILGPALVMVLKNGCHDPATFQHNWQRHETLMKIDPAYYAAQMIKQKKSK